jgi:Protein of unknown function (DUF1688)
MSEVLVPEAVTADPALDEATNDAAWARWLRTPAAIRARSSRLLDFGLSGRLPHFLVRMDKLEAVAQRVEAVTRKAYPDLEIPVHGRFTHFDAGAVPRVRELEQALAGLDASDRARAKIDLVVVSVLLDAGAGPGWKYVEGGQSYARSEGLAVASLRMFMSGAFSSDKARPLRADAAGLLALTREQLAAGFQVSDANPLVGVEGRLALLQGVGRVLPRPGALYDRIAARAEGVTVKATDVLAEVLHGLGAIWPGRLSLAGVNLGDVWPHSSLAGPDAPAHARLVPFHKLSQWLSYSLFEPLEQAGLRVASADDLTGLAEYRNGGLFVDLGVLELRDPKQAEVAHVPGDELVVEWRALTVALLDRLAPLVRTRLGKPDLPLAKILQGGTWSAGREVAEERRSDGAPPIRITSDGTVF